MEDKFETKNVQVESVNVKIIGHTHEIRLELGFSGDGGCEFLNINLRRNWFAGDLMPFDKLFDCFDIDNEDGASVEKLKYKYCRLVYLNGELYAIQHIINSQYVKVDDLR